MKYIILLLFNIFSIVSYGQINIAGKVVSSDNNTPLSGATVSIKNTHVSTSTADNGNFYIPAEAPSFTLIVTYVGYQTRQLQISVPLKEPLVIRLVPVAKKLDEVMVSTGYQQLPKERATGSFSQVGNDLLNRQVSVDVLSRLPAVANGLLSDKGTNLSGKLLIRGLSTIQGPKEPLIVVDNFPYDGDISNINPNDVESVTLLKDAAASSIWGAKAGNGVIVITTKSAAFNQPLSVEFNSNLSIGDKPDLSYLKQMSSSDFIDVEKMLYGKGYYDRYINASDHPELSPVVELLNQQTNGTISEADANAQINALRKIDVRDQFIRYVYQPSVNQQYALTLQGGSDKWKWLAFTGYDQDESDLDAGYGRLNLHFQNTLKPLKNLQLESGVYYTQSKTTSGKAGYGDITQKSGEYFLPYMQLADDKGNPVAVVKDHSLSYIAGAGDGKLLDWHYYPLEDYKHTTSASVLTSVLINAGIRYRFTKWLNAGISYRYEREDNGINSLSDGQSYYTRDMINRFTQISPSGEVSYPIPVGGIYDISHSLLQSHNLRGQLNFDHSWSDNHLVAIAGTEIRSAHTTGNQTRYYGYNSDNLSFGSVSEANAYPDFITGYADYIPSNSAISDKTIRYVSYYGNAAWTFRSKYTLSASARRDASNLFGVNTNDLWNPFWSAGAAWDLSAEPFYRWASLPFLKLRGTYGSSGNVNPSKAAVTTIQYYSTVNFYTGTPFSYFTNYNNPDLQWETSQMMNLALDFKTKNNILSGSIDYYQKKGTNLFGAAQLDYTGGVGSQINKNVAAIKGHGIDLQINSININRQVKWMTTLNYSYNADEVVTYYLNSQQASNFISFSSTVPVSGVEGKPIYSLFAYKWAGLDPETGDPQGYLDGKVSKDYRGMTVNADITDLTYVGSAIPTHYGSLINTVSYKGFSVNFCITFKLGYYFRRASINYSNLYKYWAGNADFANRWQKPGDELTTNVPSMTYPAVSARDNFYAGSEVLVYKGDHVRLQYINLEYEFTRERFPKLPLRSIQLYGNANNIGILWRANKDHIDPDYNYGLYPLPQPLAWSFGIRIKP
ncbi:MAG: SusC/RagA family TonB-linked outer membrane protein [Ginsengibacter sp.]